MKKSALDKLEKKTIVKQIVFYSHTPMVEVTYETSYWEGDNEIVQLRETRKEEVAFEKKEIEKLFKKFEKDK